MNKYSDQNYVLSTYKVRPMTSDLIFLSQEYPVLAPRFIIINVTHNIIVPIILYSLSKDMKEELIYDSSSLLKKVKKRWLAIWIYEELAEVFESYVKVRNSVSANDLDQMSLDHPSWRHTISKLFNLIWLFSMLNVTPEELMEEIAIYIENYAPVELSSAMVLFPIYMKSMMSSMSKDDVVKALISWQKNELHSNKVYGTSLSAETIGISVKCLGNYIETVIRVAKADLDNISFRY